MAERDVQGFGKQNRGDLLVNRCLRGGGKGRNPRWDRVSAGAAGWRVTGAGLGGQVFGERAGVVVGVSLI